MAGLEPPTHVDRGGPTAAAARGQPPWAGGVTGEVVVETVVEVVTVVVGLTVVVVVGEADDVVVGLVSAGTQWLSSR